MENLRQININCDGGGGSLKVLLQMLFHDDPMFAASFTKKSLKEIRSSTDKDSGVNRTFIVSKMEGLLT
jgi:hypothetical protein